MPKYKNNGLSPKQKLFVNEYPVDLNATEAALRAGYSPKSAKVIGAENLSKPAISAALEKAMTARAEQIEITAESVVKELASIAFANINDVATWQSGEVTVLDSATSTADALSAVAQVTSTASGLQLKMHDKQAALVTLGKHLGMFRERHQIEVRDGSEVVDRLFDRLDRYADDEPAEQ